MNHGMHHGKRVHDMSQQLFLTRGADRFVQFPKGRILFVIQPGCPEFQGIVANFQIGKIIPMLFLPILRKTQNQF